MFVDLSTHSIKIIHIQVHLNKCKIYKYISIIVKYRSQARVDMGVSWSFSCRSRTRARVAVNSILTNQFYVGKIDITLCSLFGTAISFVRQLQVKIALSAELL